MSDDYVTQEEFAPYKIALNQQIAKSNQALEGSSKALKSSQEALYSANVSFPSIVRRGIQTFSGTMSGNVRLTGNVTFPPFQGNPYLFPQIMLKTNDQTFINNVDQKYTYTPEDLVDTDSLGYISINNENPVLSQGTYQVNIVTNVLNDVLNDSELEISIRNNGVTLYSTLITQENDRQWNRAIAVSNSNLNVPVSSELEIHYYLNSVSVISSEDFQFYIFFKKVSDGFFNL